MSIKIRNMLIDYGNAIAVDDLSMVVETGELASLLGPSGCGKSTTLNAISGLLQVSKGQILFDGVDVTKKSPQRRNIGLVFQNYALYPHLSVFQNIAFPLHQNKNFKRDIKTNNDMLALDIKEIKHANKVIKANKLLEQSKKIFDFYLREVERSFKKVETNYNTLSKKLNDKYAVEIYGTKELNAFRSRIFIQWYDAWRAFVEQQRVGMYQNIISTFANTVLNNPDMYSSNSEIQKILKFEINIFTSRIALEQLAKSEDKVNGIENAVKSHAKTLIEEVKVSQKLAKLNGKPFVWKVSVEERENLINQRNTEFEQFQNEFLTELNNQLEETFKQLMESNSKFVELILNANDDYLDADNSKITDEQYNNLLADKKKQLTTYKRAVKTAVKEVAEKVEITSQLKKKPSELSGGQQQRVAIARAIVKKPNVLLLDEPLSNLDAKLRVSTREWIKKFQKSTGITTIFVTHDQEEAMSISDKIFIMDKGVLQQTGTPMEIYQKPANRFVANFIGTPSMNFFEEAEINNKGELILAGQKIGLSKELKDMKVTVGIRPEHIDLEASAKKTYVNKKAFTGIIDVLEQLGRTDYIKAKFEGSKDEIRIVYEAQSSTPRKLKESINLYFQSGTIYLFSKENNQELLEVL